MQLIHGFLTKSQDINNQPGAVADFFELSPFALTYSMMRGEYQHADHPGDVLHTFKAVDLDASIPYIVPDTQVSEIMQVVNAVNNYMAAHQFPYDTSDLYNTILAMFNGMIESFAFSEFYAGSDRTLPEWMIWTSVTHPNTQVKIWIRNEAFENQYSDYQIVTVPPIDVLDNFFGNYGAMITELQQITIAQTMDRIDAYKNELPETYMRILEFNYVNPNNSNQKTLVRWGVLIYGKNGDNIDSIKDAIAEYVLENSTHDQEDWEVIFPDIFRRTEFLFLPRWDQISIPNLTEMSALYSTVVDPVECVSYAEENWPEINPSWIENNLSIWPFDYKAIVLIALNGETNNDGLTNLRELFPDYIPVGTGVLDFNRMSLNTREWVVKMVELIRTAESASEFTSIQNPMRRVYRNNILYITLMHNNVNYLVAARSNFN